MGLLGCTPCRVSGHLVIYIHKTLEWDWFFSFQQDGPLRMHGSFAVCDLAS